LGLVRDLLPGPGLVAFVVDSNNAVTQADKTDKCSQSVFIFIAWQELHWSRNCLIRSPFGDITPHDLISSAMSMATGEYLDTDDPQQLLNG